MNPFTRQCKDLPNNVREKLKMTGYRVNGQQKSEKSRDSTNRQFLVLLTTSFAKDMLKQEREEIKYSPHKLMMLSTTQSTASKHKPVFMAVRSKGKCWKITSV